MTEEKKLFDPSQVPPPKPSSSKALLVIAIVVSLLAGGLLGGVVSTVVVSGNINDLKSQVSVLQTQLVALHSGQNITLQGNTYIAGENVSLAQLYAAVKDSVVVIQGLTVEYDMFRRPYYSSVQGSGFIYSVNGQTVVITNNHVVQDTINNTVTFINGNSYAATVLGSDPYSDLAVLSTEAPQSECDPLDMVSSSTLSVGDPLIAVGGPYGLAGTMTTGIVSALGRTITEDMSGGYPIANVIQMSVLINPGNSGGPLLNYKGQVVGITTAIVSDSQGLGFAIPSSTILREIDEFRKKPSTSELIDWIKALIASGVPHEAIAKEIPFAGTLLKKETDYDYFVNNYMAGGGGNLFMRRR